MNAHSPNTNAEQRDTLQIVYQDDTLVAINKPSGLLVHKSPIDKREQRYAMKILRDQIGKWVYPVHRLDKPTSGLLLFALNEQSCAQLSEQFSQRVIEKTYLALTRGWAGSGLIEHPLKVIADFKHQKQHTQNKTAQEASTLYRSLKHFELPISDGRFPSSRYSLVELKPKTGRKHQLRRHLKHISHPIIGDAKYGKSQHNRVFQKLFESSRLLLCATRLSFIHPTSKEPLTLTCEATQDFTSVLDKLKAYEKEAIVAKE